MVAIYLPDIARRANDFSVGNRPRRDKSIII
jgi:hypothetical protein